MNRNKLSDNIDFTLIDFWTLHLTFRSREKYIYTSYNQENRKQYKRYLQSWDISPKSSFRFFFFLYIDLLHFSRIKMDRIYILQWYFVIYKILYTDVLFQTFMYKLYQSSIFLDYILFFQNDFWFIYICAFNAIQHIRSNEQCNGKK